MRIIKETLTELGPGAPFSATGRCLINVTQVSAGVATFDEDLFHLIVEMHVPHTETVDTWLPLSATGATNWGRFANRRSWVDFGPAQGNIPEGSFLRVRLQQADEQLTLISYTVLTGDLSGSRE